MSRTCVGGGVETASLDGRERGATGRLAGGLRLAAAPTFALMALLAGLPGEGGPAELLCLTAGPASPFGGMVPMYLLMSAFHLPPWLALLTERKIGREPSGAAPEEQERHRTAPAEGCPPSRGY